MAALKLTRRTFLKAVPLLGAALSTRASAAEEPVWKALLQGGHVILMRHAIAPGGGDPPGFVLEDCATQRLLSNEGRAQARRAGDLIRSQGAPIDRVLSSRWCRALETAALLGLGRVEPAPPFDSFFADSQREGSQVAAMRAVLAERGGATTIAVTHQVNITALTGVFPASGEMVVIERPATVDAPIRVVGRISIQ